MFESLSYEVLKLKREKISFLDLKGLSVGEYRRLTPKEIKKLYDDCIMEGASERDALDHVLNFYSIKHLYSSSDGFHTVCISEKKRKKPSFSYSLKKDTKQKK